jgi:hypothetical protein
MYQHLEHILHGILHEARTTNWLLVKVLKQEMVMTDKITQAMLDFDTEIQQISTDISDLVARLASQPPGADADAIAAQIEAKVSALKAAADPLKTLATATPAPTPVSDTPVPEGTVPPAPTPEPTPEPTPTPEPAPTEAPVVTEPPAGTDKPSDGSTPSA